MWFDPPEKIDRRRDENKMKRIQAECQHQEEGKIQTWLDLAKRCFDKDEDPGADPTAA